MNIATRLAAVMAMCLGAFSVSVQAQAYPNRPINIVVPFNAGSSTDSIARAVGNGLSQALNVPVLVDNKPGAAGAIGLSFVAKAKADGYTVVFTTSSALTLLPLVNKSVTYNADEDFAAITNLGFFPTVLLGGPGLPQKNFRDLIAAAKSSPKSITMGVVTPFSRLFNALIAEETGAQFLEVPYSGTAPAQVALLGGIIQAFVDLTSTTAEQVKAKKLNALAVTSKKRLSKLPDVPAVGEFIPGFELVSWFGILAPKGITPDVADTLYKGVKASLKDPKVVDLMKASDAEEVGDRPDEFAAAIRAEIVRSRPIAAKYNLGG